MRKSRGAVRVTGTVSVGVLAYHAYRRAVPHHQAIILPRVLDTPYSVGACPVIISISLPPSASRLRAPSGGSRVPSPSNVTGNPQPPPGQPLGDFQVGVLVAGRGSIHVRYHGNTTTTGPSLTAAPQCPIPPSPPAYRSSPSRPPASTPPSRGGVTTGTSRSPQAGSESSTTMNNRPGSSRRSILRLLPL